MELIQNPAFLALFAVLLAVFFYVLKNQEVIPAFLFLLLASLGVILTMSGLSKIALLKAVILSVLFIVLLVSRLSRGQRFPVAGFLWLLAFMVIMIASTWTNGGNVGTYRAELGLILLALVVAMSPNKEKTVRYLTVAIALWGAVNLVAVIGEWAGVGWKYGSDAIHTSHRAVGFMGHSTVTGIYFAISLNAVHVLYFQASKASWRILLLILGIGLAIGLMGTLSRGALGAWVVSFLIIQRRLHGMRIGAILGIGVSAIVVFGLASLLSLDTLVLARFTTIGEDVSAQDRIPLIQMGIQRFLMGPVFGIGMGQKGLPHLEAHNTYMQVLMETGIVGFVIFSGMIWKTFTGLRRKYHLSNESGDGAAPYYVGLQASLVAILIDALTHVFYFLMPLWIIVGLGFML